MARSRATVSVLDKLREKRAEESAPGRMAESAELSFDKTPDSVLVPRERLRPMPNQPRHHVHDDDELRGLARSIAEEGILLPLIASRDPERPGYYILIAGHRRLAAAELLAHGDVELPLGDADDLSGKARDQAQAERRQAAKRKVATIPTIVRDVDPTTAFSLALLENLQRSDLSRREVMDAVKRLKDDYGLSIREVARRTGRDHKDLSRLIRIAEDPDVAQLVADETISSTAAGLLVEGPNRPVREPVIAAIRAGHLRTTGDIERALAEERTRRTRALTPAVETPTDTGDERHGHVGHMPHLTINNGRQADGGEGERGTEEPRSLEAPRVSQEGPGHVDAGTPGQGATGTALSGQSPTDAGRTVEVAAHTRRVRGTDGAEALDVPALQGCYIIRRSCAATTGCSHSIVVMVRWVCI